MPKSKSQERREAVQKTKANTKPLTAKDIIANIGKFITDADKKGTFTLDLPPDAEINAVHIGYVAGGKKNRHGTFTIYGK